MQRTLSIAKKPLRPPRLQASCADGRGDPARSKGWKNVQHSTSNVLTEIKEMRLDMDQRFDRAYTFLYWMVGTLLAAMGLGFTSLAIFN
jgi:hypothetical protein